jgi:glutamyl-Q tRNA(Asp) synthetase
VSVPVFRFAPSPNGELHLGHAYSALLNRRMAAASGGRLLLRIEDIDTERCTPGFEEGIYRDLAWLGLAWETPVRRQSEHFGEYAAALERLVRDELVYPAFMSRGEVRDRIAAMERRGRLWPRDPDGVPLYPGADRSLPASERRRRMAAGEPFAWRLDCAAALSRLGRKLHWNELAGQDIGHAGETEARPQDWGDVVLARRDIPTSYHLSVVLDDALQGVSHVVRGRDLHAATGVQRLLQELLGLPAPLYHHHRLIPGPDGRKLSKSLGDSGLRALREAGLSSGDVRRRLGLD